MRCTLPKVAGKPYIPMLKENNVRKGFLEYPEFRQLVDALPDHLRMPVEFGYATGRRPHRLYATRSLEKDEGAHEDAAVALPPCVPRQRQEDKGMAVQRGTRLVRLSVSRTLIRPDGYILVTVGENH